MSEEKPCYDCGSPARVSAFADKRFPYAYHTSPEVCIRMLAERVKALESKKT